MRVICSLWVRFLANLHRYGAVKAQKPIGEKMGNAFLKS